ncbi:AAA-like domain-containing protein [Myxococcota bacterium]|nr:AAA-like domain-containing protein [Myxococcota bacterium]
MDDHYKIDPLTRFDLDDILMLIAQKKYFILHAPRQTGKTSSLLALRDYLNERDEYYAVYMNVEAGQAARNEIEKVVKAAISSLSSSVDNEGIKKAVLSCATGVSLESALTNALQTLAESSQKPVVLMIDEIDALIGDSLVSVLRQIRAGYHKRPESFPQSIILCGVRDIQDYRIHRPDKEVITGGSAFNIKAKSLRIGNFSREEVEELLLQHTAETGQEFGDGVFDYVFDQTDGQPWLVNAMAYEATWEIRANRDRSVVITADMMEEARNDLVISRATHLDQLAFRLKEDRVRRIILPMINNEESIAVDEDDRQYCIDLGLLKKTPHGLEISNPIYREIIPRELTTSRQEHFLSYFTPDWIRPDGSLDSNLLVRMFVTFWRENSNIWATDIAGYEEAAPHLVFQAFLQRVANGNGTVYREYGLNRGRTDLMLKWGKPHSPAEQRVVIELKVLRPKDGLESKKQQAIEQTFKYADACKATAVYILIFDRDNLHNWSEKIYEESIQVGTYTMNIYGL